MFTYCTWLLSRYECRCESLKRAMCGAPSLLRSAAQCARTTVTATDCQCHTHHSTTTFMFAPVHACHVKTRKVHFNCHASRQSGGCIILLLYDKALGLLCHDNMIAKLREYGTRWHYQTEPSSQRCNSQESASQEKK